jgi:hypothetical protein
MLLGRPSLRDHRPRIIEDRNVQRMLAVELPASTEAALLAYACGAIRRGGRVVECGGLENRYTFGYREFESPPLRNSFSLNR